MSTPSAARPAANPNPARPEDLRRLLGIPFTAEQLSAITAPLEPAVIVAGAGSGKTSAMAARVVWLVLTGQVGPEQVLGLTFTNKAAGELADRVRTALATAGGTERPPGATEWRCSGTIAPDRPAGSSDGEPVVLTYHAFAGRLLVEHGLRIGVEPQARLLADATRFQLAQRVLRAATGPITKLTSPVRMLVADLVALDGELAEHLVEPADLVTHDRALVAQLESVAPVRAELRDIAATARKRIELAQLVEDFRAAKRRHDAVDFGDQVLLGARLAEQRPEVGEIERDRFRVVLLDEYQDTSVAQRRMLTALFAGGHPVTAVGDPCQAIYGWRGASVANLDRFPSHFPGRDGRPSPVYSLAENQRSGGLLLRLANTVSAALRRVHHGVVELRPRPAVVARGRTEVGLFRTYQEEMDWVAERVRAAYDAGVTAGQIAVLVRVRSDFAAVHAALAARDLPVEVVGLGGLLSLPEVADVVATLQVLDDPTSNAALLRLLTGPRWRLGSRDLALLGRRADDLVRAPVASDLEPNRDATEPGSDDIQLGEDADAALERAVAGVDPSEAVALADALDRPGRASYSAEGLARISALAAELRELRRHADEPLLDLLHRIITTIGLDVELAASPHALAARRRDALAAFLDQAARFVDLDGGASAGAFLAFLSAAEEYDRGLDNTSPSGRDAVALMTVHKAKGLEWDVVAVPDLTRKVFPNEPGRDRWATCAHALPHPLRGDRDDLPTVPEWSKRGVAEFVAACREVNELDERRLGYVAFTRARHHLIASGHWWGPEQKRPRGPSPFLTELRDHCAAVGGGNGSIAVWADEPAPEETNPALERARTLSWPAELDPTALAYRREAAAAVRADLAELDHGRLPLVVDDGLDHAERALAAEWDDDTDALLTELAEDTACRRVVELPRALTATQLLRLRTDPAGLARDLARPLPRRPAPAARRGTRFHAWVESQFAERPLLDPDDLPGAGDEDVTDEAKLAELQAAFLTSAYGGRRPVAVEAPFELLLAGRTVRGRIDAVYATDGGYEVVDWKTGGEPADPTQLGIYRLAWAELTGTPVTSVAAAFLYVRSGQVVRPTTLPDRPELERLLTQLRLGQ